jgi:hypothetical protein
MGVSTLAMLHIVPPGPENGGAIVAWTPINCVNLLGSEHIVGLICWHQPQVAQKFAAVSFREVAVWGVVHM